MSQLLEKIVDRNHFLFIDEVDTWQKAVELSTRPLVETGYVADGYHQQIVDCITKYGPYCSVPMTFIFILERANCY